VHGLSVFGLSPGKAGYVDPDYTLNWQWTKEKVETRIASV